jgi:hypothetical protein
MSYAASFGRADLSEYSQAERARSAALAQRLSAISVRERSGVDICWQEWGVRAEQHVDPTMLLSAEHYQSLATPKLRQ